MTRARDLANVADDVSTGTVVTTASPSLGRRNLIINGAMQVAQRGTSFTGLGVGTSYQLDRWQFNEAGTSDARFTVTQDTDAPSGFARSYKVDVTTADTGITGNEAQRLRTRLEGQDLQQLAFGTSDAKSMTLSFWVKSNKTGQYSAMVYNQHADTDRKNYKGYTIDSADTWEYKTITYEGDTDSTAAFDNDNTSGMIVWWNLSAGDGYIGSTTGWHSGTPEAVTGQVNLADSTSNYWQITGVQLEVGSVATPFEHRSYGEELALCQRYYYRMTAENSTSIASGLCYNSTDMYAPFVFIQEMRAAPSFSTLNSFRYYKPSTSDQGATTGMSNISKQSGRISVTGSVTTGNATWFQLFASGDYFELDAEL
jgi:hypothetical protein